MLDEALDFMERQLQLQWFNGQVAVSQLQQVDSKDLLQDDRPNFDLHLLQQSVLLGFFLRNPWELFVGLFRQMWKNLWS